MKYIVNILTKLCLRYIEDSPRKNPSNGAKYTRFVFCFLLYSSSFVICTHSHKFQSQALVLLEYLIKVGSERVVDDARSHVSMIKVLRNFYYIDDKGKDEGLNSKFVLF